MVPINHVQPDEVPRDPEAGDHAERPQFNHERPPPPGEARAVPRTTRAPRPRATARSRSRSSTTCQITDLRRLQPATNETGTPTTARPDDRAAHTVTTDPAMA